MFRWGSQTFLTDLSGQDPPVYCPHPLRLFFHTGTTYFEFSFFSSLRGCLRNILSFLLGLKEGFRCAGTYITSLVFGFLAFGLAFVSFTSQTPKFLTSMRHVGSAASIVLRSASITESPHGSA